MKDIKTILEETQKDLLDISHKLLDEICKQNNYINFSKEWLERSVSVNSDFGFIEDLRNDIRKREEDLNCLRSMLSSLNNIVYISYVTAKADTVQDVLDELNK